MKFKKPKTVETLEIITERCVGCKQCVEKCKQKVFAMSEGKAIVKNISACVGCGKCSEKICKFDAINLIVSVNK
ncbi:MAG: 4Fe-4S binding protein [Rikenellaceae bacterium]